MATPAHAKAKGEGGPVRRRKLGTQSANHLPYFSSGSELSIEHRLRLMSQESTTAIKSMQSLADEVLKLMQDDRARITSSTPLQLTKKEQQKQDEERDAMFVAKLRAALRRQDDSVGRVNDKIKKLRRASQKLLEEFVVHSHTLVRDHDLEKMQIMRECEQRSKINMHWGEGLITTPHESRVWERAAELEKTAKEAQEIRRPKKEVEPL